jgi:hypothetical protein
VGVLKKNRFFFLWLGVISVSGINKIGNEHVKSNIVARSRNHGCTGNSTVRSVSVAELRVAVKSMKILTVSTTVLL